MSFTQRSATASELAPDRIQKRLIPLLLIISLIFMNFIARSIFSPLLIQIEQDFSINHSQSSQLFLYITIGYVVAVLISGFISAKIMNRRTLMLSASIIVLAMLFIGISRTHLQLGIGFLMVGFGAGLYPASGIMVITDMISAEDWQKALVLHDLGPHISMMAVPFLVAMLSSYVHWRVLVMASAALMLLAGVMFTIFVKNGNTPGTPPTYSNISALFRIPSFWIMVILYSLASAGIQGVYLMTPTFLVAEAGYTVAFANALVGVTRTVTILTLATAGFVVAKAPLKTMLVLIMAVSGLSLLLTGILHGLPLIIMMCVQPAFSALFSSIGYRLLSLVGPIQLRSLSFSLVTPIGALIGTGLVPAFLGYMGSNYSFSTGFMVLGILMLLSVPLVPTIRYFHQQPS